MLRLLEQFLSDLLRRFFGAVAYIVLTLVVLCAAITYLVPRVQASAVQLGNTLFPAPVVAPQQVPAAMYQR